jgi:diaminopimelate epimerase
MGYNENMLNFHKYHGAGNDFIIIDDRKEEFNTSDKELISMLCHRRFGIGADGIILFRNNSEYDFEMVFMNSDGSIGSMCGNGGRCIVHFAFNVIKCIKDPENIKFLAIDGVHEAKINGNEVKLKMQDVEDITSKNGLIFLHSGTTPHHIQYVVNIETFPVCDEARKVREKNIDPKGVNVNYVEKKDDTFYVRTFERGVEDETLACGTGATSVAIASHYHGYLDKNSCAIKMPGGDLVIDFSPAGGTKYTDIWLTGPATSVFEGAYEEKSRYLPRFF